MNEMMGLGHDLNDEMTTWSAFVIVGLISSLIYSDFTHFDGEKF